MHNGFISVSSRRVVEHHHAYRNCWKQNNEKLINDVQDITEPNNLAGLAKAHHRNLHQDPLYHPSCVVAEKVNPAVRWQQQTGSMHCGYISQGCCKCGKIFLTDAR